MALPGTKAKDLKPGHERLKLLLYGDWKVGKTTAACQFPASYFVDTERGAVHSQYVDLLKGADSLYYGTNEFDELVRVVKMLISEKHDRKTLIIDPISTIYSDLLEVGERVKGDDWGRHYGYADQFMKRLFLLVDRMDLNCIITAHAKPEYKGTGSAMEATGKLAPDGWKKLGYQMDLLIELRRKGDLRVAEVRGSRLTQFVEGDQFEWSYAEFQSRLGSTDLERDAATIKLISPAQLTKLEGLLTKANLTAAQQAKWLKKAKAAAWDDITAEQAGKIIAALEAKTSTI